MNKNNLISIFAGNTSELGDGKTIGISYTDTNWRNNLNREKGFVTGIVDTIEFNTLNKQTTLIATTIAEIFLNRMKTIHPVISTSAIHTTNFISELISDSFAFGNFLFPKEIQTKNIKNGALTVEKFSWYAFETNHLEVKEANSTHDLSMFVEATFNDNTGKTIYYGADITEATMNMNELVDPQSTNNLVNCKYVQDRCSEIFINNLFKNHNNEAVTDLTNTVWLMKDNISYLIPPTSTLYLERVFNINFKTTYRSNEIECKNLRMQENEHKISYENSNNSTSYIAYKGVESGGTGWNDNGFKNIAIIGGVDVTDASLIEWFYANANLVKH